MIDRIYLGDRAVKGIEIDSWKRIVRIKIDVISRLKKGEVGWGYYDKEDIEDGYLVFSDVIDFQMLPLGVIPDDYILSFSTRENENGHFISIMCAGASTSGALGNTCECEIKIEHDNSWLENSLKEKID